MLPCVLAERFVASAAAARAAGFAEADARVAARTARLACIGAGSLTGLARRRAWARRPP